MSGRWRYHTVFVQHVGPLPYLSAKALLHSLVSAADNNGGRNRDNDVVLITVKRCRALPSFSLRAEMQTNGVHVSDKLNVYKTKISRRAGLTAYGKEYSDHLSWILYPYVGM